MRLAQLATTLLVAVSLGACELDGSLRGDARPVVQAPQAGSIIVAQGETVYRIASRHNLPVRAVIDANHLSPPYRLQIGQRLILPAPAPQPTMAHAAPASPAPLTAKAENRPPDVQTQSLPETSQPALPTLTGSRVLMIAMSPALGNEERGNFPQTQPPPEQQAQPLTQQQPPLPQAKPPAPAQAQAATEAQPVSATAIGKPMAKPAEAYAPLAEPPVMKGGFAWPARGKLLARFGVIGKGQRNDGLNIEVPRGAPIRAAADGIVAYAGNELRGFGNLLLIKHANGWVTAYAHNDDLLVRRGDKVKLGQVIAKAGATGNVRTPQLHFEMRKNGDAVDPQHHLPDYRVALEGNSAG